MSKYYISTHSYLKLYIFLYRNDKYYYKSYFNYKNLKKLDDPATRLLHPLTLSLLISRFTLFHSGNKKYINEFFKEFVKENL